MDHIVYLDAKAKEFEKLSDNTKCMIIRGAAGRKMPYGRVFENDVLYFVNNNGEGKLISKAKVKSVFNSEKMTKEESELLVEQNQDKLNLSAVQIKKWTGKRYLVLIEIKNFEKIEPVEFDKSNYGNMDDWLPVQNINKVMH